MKKILCPVSYESLDEFTVRWTGLLIALHLVGYLIYPSIFWLVIVSVDYLIRAVPFHLKSPLSQLAQFIVNGLALPNKKIGKAPKIFAARVGLLFAISGLLLHLFSFPLAAPICILLMLFAFLESLLNICMGCLVHYYIILKIYK